MILDDEIRNAVTIGRLVRRGSAGKWDEEAKALLSEEPNSEKEKERVVNDCRDL